MSKHISLPISEVFDLFSSAASSQDLGMVDGKAEELNVSIAGRDFTIKQSPGVLQSNRQGGTTGAAVWRASVHVAGWLASPENPLFKTGVLDSTSIVLELGSGISGLIPLGISSQVQRVVATDQHYSLKLLQDNIQSNIPAKRAKRGSVASNIDILALDWETHDTTGFLRMHDLENGVDAIFVCDCIFNYALIAPLVETCRDICQTRKVASREQDSQQLQPTLCVIAQQLRQPDVFEQWLKEFLKVFKVWRVPEDMLTQELKQGSPFAVHVGVLR